jgi:hypothetical protein
MKEFLEGKTTHNFSFSLSLLGRILHPFSNPALTLFHQLMGYKENVLRDNTCLVYLYLLEAIRLILSTYIEVLSLHLISAN